MVRVRKLVLAIAAATALSSGMAHALGVGELTLQSSLNQPLVAEIELLDVRDLSAAEMRPSLASPEEFNKAGVDRQYFLTDLKFTPIVKPNGKSVIRVTSTKPVREPYLNFLVEVLWPNGRLLREYTLLLDPPLYSPQAAAAPQLPVAAPVPAPRPAPSAAPRAAAPAPAPAAPRASSAGGDYRTNANDTLWEVAQRAGGSGSVHQKMLAIQDLNPDAFIGGNINRMKSGQVLRLPDDQQIARRSQSEALAQVGEQNSSWRQGRSAPAVAGTRQIDATRRSTAGAAPAEVAAQDKLKLVAAEAGKATAGSENGSANSAALSNQLAVTQESLDSTRRENDELKDRMTDLQSQLDKLQRLIQLKDNQLAKLQADASAPAGQAAANGAAASVGTAQAPAAPATPPTTAPAAGAPANEAPAAANEPAPAEATPADQAPSAPAAETAPTQAPEVAAEPAPAEPAAPAAETPAPAPVVAAPETAEEDSALDNLLANPMMLGLIGGSLLLALLLVLLILSRRNARKAEEEEASLAVYEEDTHRFDSDLELPADSLNDLPDDQVALSQPVGEERITAQTGDALGEADIYIAYGRFNQAAELLHNAINDEPHRTDLRLKLMEVYAELGDREGFARQESELREIGGANAQVEQLKSRYPAMVVLGGAAAAASYAAADDLDSFSLDDLALDEPEQVTAPRQPAADDAFDLDLDALEAEFAAEPLPKAQDDIASFDEIDTLSLDSDLDLHSQPPVTSKDDAFDLGLGDETTSRQELGGELADFSLDLDTPAGTTATQDDDFLLSLDDEAEKPAPDLAELSSALDNDKPEDDFGLPADFDLSLNDEPVQTNTGASFAAQLDDVTAELDQLAESLEQQGQQDMQADNLPLDEDDDFDFLSGTDETATKLDLARAYIDMGDTEGARDILDEVIAEGNDGQQQEARELIGKLV
ncbi:FimV/HubP family polar landmark protein [Phytopseudomonas punonensis]|uniref:Pilus assembly protein FimV n=1 Tax=Phytopseudomonas punonensis TaxID=1220495 RepID=A0A1M7CZU5_9GAMM|nr:FimV/HubP family polar landmark protein [Pseudomonas punonensis]SHL72744.1 pilus assembly protein FimV [Pseudomonas punonensis]